jgi:UPF0755 protein
VNRALVAVAAIFIGIALTALGWFIYVTPDVVYGDDEPEVRDVPPPPGGDPLLILIEQGESAKSIGAVLEEQGIVSSGRHFEVLVGMTGVANSLEAGEYEFDRGIPVLEAVNRIAEGRTASRRVVIPEGLRAEEIGEILERGNIVTKDAFMAALVKSEYTHPFLSQVQAQSLDGFLFPAAYEFRRSVTPREVVDTLLLGFQTNVADQIQLEGQPYTLEQVVTIAAIVEREATVASEHPIVASVFLNRLQQGIALQADPTVQYALTQDPVNLLAFGYWKAELTFEDLEFDSPYNTYVYAGLTPGPIANPGLDTIQAVIRPADTPYLYFVAKGDGTHAFAETLDEHFANIDLYQ